MTELTIPPGERGLVRVFSLSLDPTSAKKLKANQPPEDEGRPSPIEAALGTTDINAEFVEVFPLSDIEELGLAGYLEEGNGIDPAHLDPDRRKLAALEGWVLLVYSGAFGGRGATLKPSSDLTLIGTYAEQGVDWSDQTHLRSAAAEGTAAPARKKTSDAAKSGRVALIALLIILVLTIVMIWVA